MRNSRERLILKGRLLAHIRIRICHCLPKTGGSTLESDILQIVNWWNNGHEKVLQDAFEFADDIHNKEHEED